MVIEFWIWSDKGYSFYFIFELRLGVKNNKPILGWVESDRCGHQRVWSGKIRVPRNVVIRCIWVKTCSHN